MNQLKQAIQRALDSSNRIAITTHINPDGDGYCAALALQRILACQGKQSTIWMDADELGRFDFLLDDRGAEVKIYQPELDIEAYDIVFVLDCNSYDRIGQRKALLDKAKILVMLDHHMVEHNYIEANISFVEPAYVSVGAIIFHLWDAEIAKLDTPDRIYIGNCLYTTILNDTNNYANANTNEAVFTFAADLCKLGIKPQHLYKEFFLNHAAEEMRYVGQTLATIELHLNRKLLFMHSTLQMSQENNLDPESVMNITRWVQGVKGLDAIVYFREEASGVYKLSLRSIKLDMNKIAIRYGGGGHRQASGCTVKGSLGEVKSMLLKDIQEAISAL